MALLIDFDNSADLDQVSEIVPQELASRTVRLVQWLIDSFVLDFLSASGHSHVYCAFDCQRSTSQVRP